jgi:hypothetical protein
MKITRLFRPLIMLGLAAFLFLSAPQLSAAGVPDGVWVRPGYELTVAVDSINTPRFLEFGPDGTLFVSVPKVGKILACRDEDGNGHYEKVMTFLEGKDPKSIPQGMQFHDGWLWYAQLRTHLHSRG